MKTTSLVLAAAAFASLSTAALAQTNTWVEVDDKTIVAPFNVDADRLEDMDVQNEAGQKIGEIEDVIGTERSAATALVVDFDDNAGFGDRDDVIVPLDRFSLNGVNIVLKDNAETVAGYETYKD
ncbi:PRC-barrel domain-containing protein [Tianweitania sp. BSSL-BM11]|uniref:PRC-barrel domain-containing protein n=1 Tax=Tianweitania aestuarii TaxID=2814886 RepID=A0ABS5RWX3_9HYPH|nr:PRC-barrel domain-containing protein [Tianweitania aestuarii]MBS9720704.1 PRC-barrel domain-containing protein [Tianweitania aestuarii]